MKKIVFEYDKSLENIILEIVEYEDEATNEEIQKDFEQWVLKITADKFKWYEDK